MNGTNGNEPGYPENALVPYPVIVAATKGDPDAMKIVLQHFSGYIARLSMRKLYDERGNVYFGVDHDIRERLQAKLMMAVLTLPAPCSASGVRTTRWAAARQGPSSRAPAPRSSTRRWRPKACTRAASSRRRS